MLNNNDEQWKVITDFPKYEVSTFGNVRVIKTGKIRIPSTINSGYHKLSLSKAKVKYSRTVHRLVMLTFSPIPNASKMQVNHIDGDKKNNNLSNLEWVTCGDNHRHAYETGLKDSTKNKYYVGLKHAKSVTKYHNVSYDKNRDLFIGKVTHNNKHLEPKRFKTEEEAALHVNYIIDKYNLTRPKNVII